jgi:hypothetical protein
MRLLSVDEHRTLAVVLNALRGFYDENLQQVQAQAQSASTTKSALRMKRWRSLCPILNPSLLLILACVPPRAECGNAARLRLYFVGYVTAYPRHPGNVPSALSTLSSIPIVRCRLPQA